MEDANAGPPPFRHIFFGKHFFQVRLAFASNIDVILLAAAIAEFHGAQGQSPAV